jgi:D-alanyl-D-alanine carboxypeptidase
MFNNFKIHSGLNGKTTSEIASLTKIMTFTVIIEICQRFNLDS